MTPSPHPLPGEAPPTAFRAVDGDGQPVEPNEVIFPIVRQERNARFRLIGTGFFITDNGLFASAKHVLLDVIDKAGNQTAPIGLFQFLPGDNFLLRPILRCVSHDLADVAVGVAAPMTDKTGAPLKNKLLTLTTEHPVIGAPVATYAYPKTLFRGGRTQGLHFYPAYFEGRIEAYFASGRDRILMPAACFQTSMHVYGGASGGPVFGADGAAFGINSSGYDGTDCSFVSRIADILPLRVSSVITPRSSSSRGVVVRELADDGFVIVRGPTSKSGQP